MKKWTFVVRLLWKTLKKKKEKTNIMAGKEISGNRNKNRWNVKFFSTVFVAIRVYEIRGTYDYMLKQEINTWTDFSVNLYAILRYTVIYKGILLYLSFRSTKMQNKELNLKIQAIWTRIENLNNKKNL